VDVDTSARTAAGREPVAAAAVTAASQSPSSARGGCRVGAPTPGGGGAPAVREVPAVALEAAAGVRATRAAEAAAAAAATAAAATAVVMRGRGGNRRGLREGVTAVGDEGAEGVGDAMTASVDVGGESTAIHRGGKGSGG